MIQNIEAGEADRNQFVEDRANKRSEELQRQNDRIFTLIDQMRKVTECIPGMTLKKEGYHSEGYRLEMRYEGSRDGQPLIFLDGRLLLGDGGDYTLNGRYLRFNFSESGTRQIQLVWSPEDLGWWEQDGVVAGRNIDIYDKGAYTKCNRASLGPFLRMTDRLKTELEPKEPKIELEDISKPKTRWDRLDSGDDFEETSHT